MDETEAGSSHLCTIDAPMGLHLGEAHGNNESDTGEFENSKFHISMF